MDDFVKAVTMARNLRMAMQSDMLMFLDPNNDYGTLPYSLIPSGVRLISVGFYGPDGFQELVQDLGVKP